MLSFLSNLFKIEQLPSYLNIVNEIFSLLIFDYFFFHYIFFLLMFPSSQFYLVSISILKLSFDGCL